nr:reverse transcriptase domain-containing protein [Tanacetum cinerariifolium]
MFNPQEFFFLEELLPPKKRGRDRSSSSTSSLPREFEIGESSRMTSLELHEQQIEEILNHLDKLSLDRIENIEDNIEGLGKEQANKITWTELKRLLTNKYCPRNEVKKMEDEFYNLIIKGNDLKTYIRRFQELAVLCPNMVPNTEKLKEVFIRGLPQSIKGIVTVSKPQTLEEAIKIAQRLMDQIIKRGSMQGTSDHKRKFDDRRSSNNNNNNNNYPINRVNNYQNNRNNNSNW